MDTKALRQKILDLAIRGKLVPQDPNDEPASVLLEKIRAQKQQMVQEGRLKAKDIKNDTIIYIGEDNLPYEKFTDGSVKCIKDEIPFEIPEGWAWSRLKNICMMSAGKSKPTAQIKSKPFKRCYPCFGGNGIRGYVNEYNYDGTYSIIGRQGALCGNIKIAHGKFYATEHAVVTTLFSGIDFNWSNYILEALKLGEYASGAAQPGLSVVNVLNIFIPVPPMQEQIRIGLKVAESLKIIELLVNENLYLQILVSYMKSKILDHAIRGKLVPQNPNDEPASVLLERIREEKEELIKQGKIKKDKHESIIFRRGNSHYEKFADGSVKCIDNEIPFEIPKSWEWCRLRTVIELRSGQDMPVNQYNAVKKGIPYITGASNIENATVIINRWTENGRTFAYQGDILLTCKGTVGAIAILQEKRVHIARQIMAIRPSSSFYKPYIQLVLETLVNNLKAVAKGLIPGISREDVLNSFLPVPPLAEQKRIVEKIDSILPLLKTL